MTGDLWRPFLTQGRGGYVDPMKSLPSLSVLLSLALLPACDACNKAELERIAALEAELEEIHA